MTNFWRRLRARLRRDQLDEELHEEMRAHVQMRADDNEADGMDLAEAQRRARVRFGNVTRLREESRDEWSWRALDTLAQDLRYAARMARRAPGFTLSAVLVIALGIGANTAVFSLINTALLGWSGPLIEPERLVMVWQQGKEGLWTPSPADFRDWQARARSLAQLAAYHYRHVTLTNGPEPERVLTARASSNLFPMLGIAPQLGRGFRADEERWGSHRVVLLSHRFWIDRLGGSPAIVGQPLNLDGEPHLVAGVMPAGAWFASTSVDAWVPMAFAPDDPANDRHSHFLFVLGRLKPDVSLEQANSEIATIAGAIAMEHPANQGLSATVRDLRSAVVGNVQPMLVLLAAAVGLVLLISCANVANLLLVRGAAREREMAVRASVGASRVRLVRQLLTESFCLALVGALAGGVLAVVGVHAALEFLPAGLPRVREAGVAVDARVLLFTLGMTLLTGVLFGLAPAWQVSRQSLGGSLKERGRGTVGGGRERRLRHLLIVVDIALALVLSIGAGLFMQTFVHLQKVDVGVAPEQVVSVRLPLAPDVESDPQKVARYFSAVVDRVRAVPGVASADMTSHLPLAGGGQSKYFAVEGHPWPTSLDQIPTVSARQEGPKSLQTLGVTLLRGRYFSDRDRAGGQRVAMIGESVAKQFFKEQDPLGQQILLDPPEHLIPAGYAPPGTRMVRHTIVGVVRDVRYQTLRGNPELLVYLPYLQRAAGDYIGWAPEFLVIRASGEASAVVPSVRQAIWTVSPSQPIADIRTIEDLIEGSLKQPRFTMLLLAGLAAIGILLASVGIYGVMAYAVSRRRQEIGVRMALGASTGSVAALVLGEALRLDAIGIAVGLALAVPLVRLLQGLLFGVEATDLTTMMAVSALMAAVALAAAYIPARRAMHVDPATALRCE